MFTLTVEHCREWDEEDDENPGLWHRESERVSRRSLCVSQEDLDQWYESCIPDDPENPYHLTVKEWITDWSVIRFLPVPEPEKIECPFCSCKHFRIFRYNNGIITPQCVECGRPYNDYSEVY
jgi:hypothetical protein